MSEAAKIARFSLKVGYEYQLAFWGHLDGKHMHNVKLGLAYTFKKQYTSDMIYLLTGTACLPAYRSCGKNRQKNGEEGCKDRQRWR